VDVNVTKAGYIIAMLSRNVDVALRGKGNLIFYFYNYDIIKGINKITDQHNIKRTFSF